MRPRYRNVSRCTSLHSAWDVEVDEDETVAINVMLFTTAVVVVLDTTIGVVIVTLADISAANASILLPLKLI